MDMNKIMESIKVLGKTTRMHFHVLGYDIKIIGDIKRENGFHPKKIFLMCFKRHCQESAKATYRM